MNVEQGKVYTLSERNNNVFNTFIQFLTFDVLTQIDLPLICLQ